MFITITARNYTYIVVTFCPHQKDNSIIEPTKALHALFTIRLPRVLYRKQRGIECRVKLGQINTVIL